MGMSLGVGTLPRNSVSRAGSREAGDEFVKAIRNNFPRADVDASGRGRVFFDNGAGSLVLQGVVDAEAKALLDYASNVGEPSWESKMNEEVILAGRRAVRDFLNAPSEDCVVSGESTSSMLFHLSYALSKEISSAENIVTTEYEHYANISPWIELERRGIVKEVRFTKFNPDDGMLDMSHLASLIDRKTRVVSVTGVANALGSKTPVADVFKLAKEVGAYAVMDAVHMAPHVPIDVKRINCDFAVFSGYKLFSRRGSFMYGRRDLLETLKPYKVDPAPDQPPGKWELGTRDQSLFASITAVMEYLSWLGEKVGDEASERISDYTGRVRLLKAALSWIDRYEQTLSKAMLTGVEDTPGMLEIGGVELYGSKDPAKVHLRGATFSFNIVGADPYKVAERMWQKHAVVVLAEDNGGFYSRALRSYGKSVAVRASLVHFNTVEEVRTFLCGLSETVKHFSAG